MGKQWLLLLIIYSFTSFAFLKVNNHINRVKKLNLIENKKIDVKSIRTPNKEKNMQFGLGRIAFSLIPLAPETGGRRKTIIEEIVPNTIWTLDQIQGIINVLVPVRSTVIKLKEGGLWVHNPIAPTEECINYMRNFGSINIISYFFHHNCISCHCIFWDCNVVFPGYILNYLPVILS